MALNLQAHRVDGAFPEGPHVLVGQDRGFVVDGAGARSAEEESSYVAAAASLGVGD